MNDLISKQKVISLPVKPKENRYFKTQRRDDAYEYGWHDLQGCIEKLPSTQPDNQTNLCDSCDYLYPDCPSGKDDVIFGNGIGNDNICACNKYKPFAQLERCSDCIAHGGDWECAHMHCRKGRLPSAQPEQRWIPVIEWLPDLDKI